jgi:4-amino-4-deoxy-L-arabinose transferase-like glycosyltransferase
VNISLLRSPAPGTAPAVSPGTIAPPGSAGTGASNGTPRGAAQPAGSTPARAAQIGDRPVLVVLLACFAALTALTWRRWGMPEIDAGAELTTADLVKHGALAYRDVRYYYGPLGLYSLALSFKLFGTSFTTAYAFGLAQTAAILGAFYALARHWLAPLVAGLSTAVLMAIGFSGTAFNFILPHTNSATFGLLFALLALLALTRHRLWLAGAAVGLVGLTRPEFLAVAAGALAAYVLAQWRFAGRAAAWRAAWRLALPAVAIPVVVLGWFATRAGLGTLVGENLWPVKFISVGAKTETSWMPFTAGSFVGLALRGALYCGLLAALVASVEGWSRRGEPSRDGASPDRDASSRGGASSTGGSSPHGGGSLRGGASRLLAFWPLLAALVAIAAVDGALRASGVLAGQRGAIELEARHLMLGMSWLPVLGLAVGAWAALRFVRRGGSPLGGEWPVDLALIVVAAGLGLRAYNAFTTEGSYAPYYAAPLVLLLGILHTRVAERRPRARLASFAALGLVAAGLAAYALGGLYVHDNTAVHTPRGTFVTDAAAAPALQAAVARIDALTRPGERILAAPLDGGLYFMADRRPALYELSLLPGLLDSPAEENAAIARLRRDRVTLAVLGARDFSAWGTRTFGVNYDSLLGAYLHENALSASTVGTLANPVAGTYPSKGFTVVRLRP